VETPSVLSQRARRGFLRRLWLVAASKRPRSVACSHVLRKRVHTSVNAARTSARATVWAEAANKEPAIGRHPVSTKMRLSRRDPLPCMTPRSGHFACQRIRTPVRLRVGASGPRVGGAAGDGERGAIHHGKAEAPGERVEGPERHGYPRWRNRRNGSFWDSALRAGRS
jgi:hypothetical protein